MEQVNIVGKRSGEGFVAHKDTLANALSRVLAERVTLFSDDLNIGRKASQLTSRLWLVATSLR